jgi:hypothetical protein
VPYRSSARERGYTRAWEKARARYMRQHPLCVDCSARGELTPARVVDHKVPHRGDPGLFWDEENWQAAEHGHIRGVGADGWPLQAEGGLLSLGENVSGPVADREILRIRHFPAARQPDEDAG